VQYQFDIPIEEHVSRKIYLGLFSKAKVRKETILTSYIDLLSQQPNSTTKSANRAGFDFACQLFRSSKGHHRNSKYFFLPSVWLSK